ncbi:unnamed protein product [Symbiodinium sp. CCMP2456]|nr:unnamed protein product [Symbiodinium sp. CCMP2456]
MEKRRRISRQRLLFCLCLALGGFGQFGRPAAAFTGLPRFGAGPNRHSRLQAGAQGPEELAWAEPASTPERRSEWQQQALLIWVSVVALWTFLDCVVDPGVKPFEDPGSLLNIALPTSVLVAPGAAVAASAQLAPRPTGISEAKKMKTCAVFVGDSLTSLSLAATEILVLDTLESDLLEEASALQPSHGLVLLLGTNDLIRYTAVAGAFRVSEEEWLASYEGQLQQAVSRISRDFPVLLASPPPLGEDLNSEEARLGASMAKSVCRVAEKSECIYVPLFEACADHLNQAAANGSIAAKSRAYSLGESLLLLCALPWRLYAGRGESLQQIQKAAGLELTVDLVHYGPVYGDIASRLFIQKLGITSSD